MKKLILVVLLALAPLSWGWWGETDKLVCKSYDMYFPETFREYRFSFNEDKTKATLDNYAYSQGEKEPINQELDLNQRVAVEDWGGFYTLSHIEYMLIEGEPEPFEIWQVDKESLEYSVKKDTYRDCRGKTEDDWDKELWEKACGECEWE